MKAPALGFATAAFVGAFTAQAGGCIARIPHPGLSPPGKTITVAFPAKAFIASIGVNTHVTYDNPAYNNLPIIANSLQYLGISHVRDTAPEQQDVWRYEKLARIGVTFDVVLNGRGADFYSDLPLELAGIGELITAAPGSVASIEGPNEVNTQILAYRRRSTVDPKIARAAMQALARLVRSDPSLPGIPLISLSISNGTPDWKAYQASLGDLSRFSDRANWHVYFDEGDQPAPSIGSMYLDALRTAPGKPVIFTEMGYFTGYMNASRAGVDEAIQAKHTLNALLDAFKSGVAHTYIYELMEGSINPSRSDSEQTFGLFRANGTPKPAAVAIHNLTSILATRDRSAHPRRPDQLPCPLLSLPKTANSLLLRGRNQAFYVVVWNEPPDWDPATRRPVKTDPVTITADLGSPAWDVEVYDPLRGTTAIARFSGTRFIPLRLSDHPLIMEITAPPDARRPAGSED